MITGERRMDEPKRNDFYKHLGEADKTRMKQDGLRFDFAVESDVYDPVTNARFDQHLC